MILVDTSIWIDHLHEPEPVLSALLARDAAGIHAFVIEELALGSMRQRDVVLHLLGNLYRFPAVTHDEFVPTVDSRSLWGRGLSMAEVHRLGSVALVGGARMWTRDKRLRAACADVGVAVFDEV